MLHRSTSLDPLHFDQFTQHLPPAFGDLTIPTRIIQPGLDFFYGCFGVTDGAKWMSFDAVGVVMVCDAATAVVGKGGLAHCGWDGWRLMVANFCSKSGGLAGVLVVLMNL